VSLWEFSQDFFYTIFARLPPLASAARYGPHLPRYATENEKKYTKLNITQQTQTTKATLVLSPLITLGQETRF